MYNTVKREHVRVGDEVWFSNKGVRITGIVEKVNRKSIKVRQNNDACRYSQPAFGHRGGRKMGGQGALWTCGVGDDGTTTLHFTTAQEEHLEGTARSAMLHKSQRTEVEGMLEWYVKQYLGAGGDREELLKLVTRQAWEYEAQK